jgi:hypothetical protein
MEAGYIYLQHNREEEGSVIKRNEQKNSRDPRKD